MIELALRTAFARLIGTGAFGVAAHLFVVLVTFGATLAAEELIAPANGGIIEFADAAGALADFRIHGGFLPCTVHG